MVPEEERAHGTISRKTYLLFLKEGLKSHFMTVVFLAFFLLVEVCTQSQGINKNLHLYSTGLCNLWRLVVS